MNRRAKSYAGEGKGPGIGTIRKRRESAWPLPAESLAGGGDRDKKAMRLKRRTIFRGQTGDHSEEVTKEEGHFLLIRKVRNLRET